MPNLIVDVDGVLLNWRHGNHYWQMKNNSSRPLADLSFDDMAAFNQSESFASLLPFPDAQLYLPEIKRRGYTIHAITACGTRDVTKRNRIYNLHRCFSPIFDRIMFVDIGESKLPALKSIGTGWYVEDHPPYVDDGVQSGHSTIQYAHVGDWYQEEAPRPGAIPATGWAEIATLLR